MLVIGQQITCLDIESEISKDERVVGGEGPEEEEEEGAEEGNLDRKSFHGSGSVFWIIFCFFFLHIFSVRVKVWHGLRKVPNYD